MPALSFASAGCRWRRTGSAGRGTDWRAQRLPLLALLLLLLVPAAARAAPRTPRAEFFRLLHAGDSAYAQRQGYHSIRTALRYFDRAYLLAEGARDTLLLAEATFAKGRVYDAWNKNPRRTIAYFRQAAALFKRLPAATDRYYYARYLVVHAYDKVPDTLGTTHAARALYHELRALPLEQLRRIPTTVELAWTATEVGAYALADSILHALTHRSWIANDPETYDHLTHYYLVQARLDAYHRQRLGPAYLDSLDDAYQRLTTLLDREYYSRALAPLFEVAQDYPRAYQRLKENGELAARLAAQTNVPQLRLALLRSEQRAQAERLEQARRQQRLRRSALAGLAAGLGLLMLLILTLYRQRQNSRQQAGALAAANHQLDDKVAQVELLNKEIQHRVKNNLHMIFSLLQMQEWKSENEEVIENLQAARLRVESVAALHNQLLANPAALDLGRYLRELISAVVSCLANDRQIVTHLHTEALHLPTNAYFALSLILNEWVTNTIKYAYVPMGGLLEITVRMRTTPQEVCIVYTDNGAPSGAPPAPSGGSRATTLASSGLGTEIIQLLTRQLRARLRTLDNHPYRYELCIPTGGTA